MDILNYLVTQLNQVTLSYRREQNANVKRLTDWQNLKDICEMESFPEGLTQKEFAALSKCANEVANLSVGRLLSMAEAYLKRIRMLHSKNLHINVRLAEAIVHTFQEFFDDWENIPPHARSWCRGMVQYFCVSDDDEHDFTSPTGFEDDAKIMNACLRLAGREDLCINPKDYDN